MELRIQGANQLSDLAKALKAAGDDGKGLRKELLKGIRTAAKPLVQDARTAAAAKLPSSGGLAAEVAASKFAVRTRTSGQNAGVRIQATGKKVRDIRSTDRGRLRHPVYGHMDRWVTQSVAPGWFTEAMQAGSPHVRKEVVAAMERVAQKIARSA